MNTLTLSEALAQGYTNFVFNKDGYQSLKELSHISQADFDREDIRLVEKEPYHPSGISPEDLAELIAENIECNHAGETGDDTMEVYESVKAINFTDASERIQEVLDTLNYYRATDIKVIPD